ncbi:uncharacterized protein LOC130998001 [Salvia miltiorrhiza]|uniref:uncharacterized protein LOC130998001 n=1 Tax=Salvia miltiorrhiza TaxID=226208 RepID=UPI0025AC116C|nr:uncharacterized protein LOC130998001 [Salvia miltiorrhiza]
MEEGSMFFDASAHMLFEASGDSEAAYFDAAFEQESDAAAVKEDDAQSCSYSSSCDNTARLHEAVDGGDDIRSVQFDYCSGDDEDDYGGGSDEEDGVVDQCRRRSRNSAAEPAKSKGCEESNVMMMNEREGDRLFWEACLAS